MTNSYISPCDLEEMLYNIHEAGNFNLYTIGNPIYFPQAWHNIFSSNPVTFDPEELPSRNWRRVWVSLGTLALLYGVTVLSKGTLLPFTAPKKAAAKATLLGRAIGAGKAVTARGVGDLSEFAFTGEWSYDSLPELAFGYTFSAFTGGITVGMNSQNLRTFISVASQPVINEVTSAVQGNGFNIQNLAFNIIARSFTRDMNPFAQGFLRGGSRGVRKRNI